MSDLAELRSFILDWEIWIAVGMGLFASLMAFWAGRASFRALLKRRSHVPSEENDVLVLMPFSTNKVDPFDAGSPTEKRASLRRKGNNVEVHLTFVDDVRPPIIGRVLDRSMGGLRLRVETCLPVGTILRARATHAPPGTPWTEIEVKTCLPVSSSWLLGCAYCKTPSWSVMMLFG